MNSLLKLRKNSGLTQQELADYIGVSRGLINMAEKGLRELPKKALIKLAEIEKVIVNDLSNKPAMPTPDDKTTRQLKDYHKFKIEEYLFRAKGLGRQLSGMLKSLQKTDAKIKLVSGLVKNKQKTGKNKVDDIWTEYHAQQSNKKLSKYFPTIQMIFQDIEVLRGYAAVHEKVLKKIL